MNDLIVLKNANWVLSRFAPWLLIEERRSQLWLVKTDMKLRSEQVVRIRLRKDGLYPTCGEYNLYGCGGTYTGAIVQLVHWIRGEPRKPLCQWVSWLGAESSAVRILSGTSYLDSKLTSCILCGAADPLDWYTPQMVMTEEGKMIRDPRYLHRPQRPGPLCYFGQCQKRMGE